MSLESPNKQRIIIDLCGNAANMDPRIPECAHAIAMAVRNDPAVVKLLGNYSIILIPKEAPAMNHPPTVRSKPSGFREEDQMTCPSPHVGGVWE